MPVSLSILSAISGILPTYLLHNFWTVFFHSIHDGKGGIHPTCTGGLRSHSERVYESLRVVLSDVGQEIVNVPASVRTRCLDASDDL